MTLKFYMTPGSCSTGIHILLEELDLPFEVTIVNMPAGDHRRPEYLALNPKGTIPTLVLNATNVTFARVDATCSTAYLTGTVAYDHQGGTYDRLLTLTDGTWPAWAAPAASLPRCRGAACTATWATWPPAATAS